MTRRLQVDWVRDVGQDFVVDLGMAFVDKWAVKEISYDSKQEIKVQKWKLGGS